MISTATGYSRVRVSPAWLALTAGLALHVVDEALNDFLAVYNPTVVRIRETLPFLPLPTFTFRVWLSGLILAVVVLGVLGSRTDRRGRWVRPLGYAFAVLMIGNALLHLSVSVARGQVMPGTYSSPILLLAAVNLLRTIHYTRAHEGRPLPRGSRR